MLSEKEFLLTVLVLTLSVQLTRWLPFLLFGEKKELPPLMGYLGKVLPAAMMGLLVVYCFKDASWGNAAEILPLLLASAGVAGLHLWKRNTVLSIGGGTLLYMLLLRLF